MRIEYLTLLFTILLQLKKHVNLLSFQKEKTIIDTGRKRVHLAVIYKLYTHITHDKSTGYNIFP